MCLLNSKVFRYPFFLLVLVFSTLAAHAKVAPVSIETLIKRSDLIVVGRVTEIRQIEGVNFATIEVLQTLKGNTVATVFYSAERTWPCDSSDAVDGETALFFFTTYRAGKRFGRSAKQTEPLDEAVKRTFTEDELFRLAYDGRGRMPIKDLVSDKLLEINPSVILPKNLRHELVDVTGFIDTTLRAD